MKFLVGEWLKAAKDDIAIITEIIDNEHLTHMVAFHAHQCIEKCFKATLEHFEEEIGKIHDLRTLYKKVTKHIKLDIDSDLIEKLSGLYIDARYPGELGLLPYGKPTISDAQKFHQFAEKIYNDIWKALE